MCCVLSVGMIAGSVLPAHAQPADPTSVELVPRALSLEVDDPDIHIKKAANDIVNQVILSSERFNALLGVSYGRINAAVARFNTTNYGRSVVFLKGGNALRQAYETNIRPSYTQSGSGMLSKCEQLFEQSDIDYAVNTTWNSNVPSTARDFWLRDPASNNEYGYQILNSLVAEEMDRLRGYLLDAGRQIVFQDPKTLLVVQPDHIIMQELNKNFNGDSSLSFLQKWADYRAAQIDWFDVPLPNEPIFLSHQIREFRGEKPAFTTYPDDELLGFNDDEETKKYNDIRNTALPDKVILEGPTPQLLYSYQRNHHVSSIYLTSNYSETWPSDPSIDPAHYTKFALHRLKLALPFRITLHKTLNASKPFKKLVAKSFPLIGDQVGNVLVVGGELIDVGVDHPSAALLGHPSIDPNELVTIQVQVGNATVPVRAAGGDWLIRDLKEVIFDIVGMPWKKKKFDKRAGRFMCMIRPSLREAGIESAVNQYLGCLKTMKPASQCVPPISRGGQDKYRVIVDFFIGIDDNRHSLRRVMGNLPEDERTNAQNYLTLLQGYLE